MKRILSLSLLFGSACYAQNGFNSYPLPTGFTQIQLRSNAICCDNSGNKWIAFQSIGLGKFDGSNWTVYNTSNSGLPGDSVQTVTTDPMNNIWVGTTRGVGKFDGNTWTNYSQLNSGIASDTVYSIAFHNADIWFGTRRGISKFDGSVWTTYNTSNSGLINDNVNSVKIDQSGTVWCGTPGGISSFDGTSWNSFTTVNSALTNNTITSIFVDPQNQVWFGSTGGVYIFHNSTVMKAITVYPDYVFFFPGGNVSLGPGPHGGCMFGPCSSTPGSFAECDNGNFHIYYKPAGYTGILMINARDPSTGKIWMAYKISNASNTFHSFDASSYNGYCLGLTSDNCRHLDYNEVDALIMNRGDMHWNLSSAGYEIPKGSGKTTIFASDLWIGGLDAGGDLHQASGTYRQTGLDFWPGPLDTTNGNADSLLSSPYDYIWKIRKEQILEFQYYWNNGSVQNGSYIPDVDILTWPANGNGNFARMLAPFVDMDQDGIYDPIADGDYPIINGDEELYCIFNDNLATHTESGGTPLKVEIHLSAYSSGCNILADSERVLNYTTFYRYEIFNRSNQNYHSCYVGAFVDVDLGAYDDDYIGCYPPANFAYVYNDSVDFLYGTPPPFQCIAILDGPLANAGDGIDNDNDGIIDETGEKNLMTASVSYNNDFTFIGNPQEASDYYGYLAGQWPDSTYITYGGNGYGGTTPYAMMYPSWAFDTSSTAWSEVSVNHTPFDRRIVVGSGPFDLPAGGSVRFEYADVFSQDTSLVYGDTAFYWQSWRDVNRVRRMWSSGHMPSCAQWNVGVQEESNEIEFGFYPNPADEFIMIDYMAESSTATYEIFDMTGRTCGTGKLSSMMPTRLAVSELSCGIYAVKVTDGIKTGIRRFVISR